MTTVRDQTVSQWETAELAFRSAGRYSNPFTEVACTATFTHEESGTKLDVDGFYDGDDTWRMRFLAGKVGDWTYVTSSADRALDGQTGRLTCIAVPPDVETAHGPLQVDGLHFRHADGTRPYLISTRLTCLFRSRDELRPLVTFLAKHHINRVLFMMGGAYGTVQSLYGDDGDRSRYSIERFRAIDAFIVLLGEHGLIASPYFYYFTDGFQRELTPAQDRAYLRYGMARFGAFANVIPVLANEVEKKYTDSRTGQYHPASWVWANEMGEYLKKKAVFGVPVTVHDPQETDCAVSPGYYTLLAQWPFPWTDCMLRQAQLAALSGAPEVRDDVPESKLPVYNARGYARQNQLFIDLRRYGIPMINEEPGYEMEGQSAVPGDADVEYRPWNSQSAETLIPTFWSAVCAGAYVMWGSYATYWFEDALPGMTRSATPNHLKVLHECMATLPYWEMEPANDAVSANEVVIDGQDYRTTFCLAKAGEAYLVFALNPGAVSVEVADGSYSVTQVDPRTGARDARDKLGRGGSHTVVLEEREQVLVIRRGETAERARP